MGIKERLDKLDSNEGNLNSLYDIFREIHEISIPIIRYTISVGTPLIRMRINDKGKDFTRISDLSYPPSECVREYGRANIPYNPMFYCCTFNVRFKEDAPYPRVVALLETSSFAREINCCGIERVTCSKWIPQRELNLVALPYSSLYKRSNDDMNIIQQEWDRLKTLCDIDKSGLELVEYMADEIAKDYQCNIEYFKIAHFIYYLLNINPKTREADGILYPSVRAGGECFNIAIKPEVVDNHIIFEGASLCYLAKKFDQMHLEIINYSCLNDDSIEYIRINNGLDDSPIFNNLEFIN